MSCLNMREGPGDHLNGALLCEAINGLYYKSFTIVNYYHKVCSKL
jgi:hypothetical protein